jgi:WD40 repeat protein
VRYSPDGKWLIAGDYPGSVVQVWDIETGKQLTKIETGFGYRGSTDSFFVSPDFKTVFVPREKRKATRYEKDGKRLIRWEFDGDVRAWDLESGKFWRTFTHTPARGVWAMELAPDGTNFVTFEHQSGESPPGEFGYAASLWDVRSGKCRPLPQDLSAMAAYAPDSKTFAARLTKDGRQVTALAVIDVATTRPKISIPISAQGASLGYVLFSPDGALLAGEVRERKTGQHWLKLWDPASGKEIASFEGEKNEYFMRPAFSPNGKVLAVPNGRDAKSKLFLIDVSARKVWNIVLLSDKAVVRDPVFSPDGRWIAIATQVFPEELERTPEPKAEDVPQPRIHLVEAATGQVRETLVAPPGFPVSLCFSPDGRTLATAGHGRVLLWDLTRPPGSARGR